MPLDMNTLSDDATAILGALPKVLERIETQVAAQGGSASDAIDTLTNGATVGNTMTEKLSVMVLSEMSGGGAANAMAKVDEDALENGGFSLPDFDATDPADDFIYTEASAGFEAADDAEAATESAEAEEAGETGEPASTEQFGETIVVGQIYAEAPAGPAGGAQAVDPASLDPISIAGIGSIVQPLPVAFDPGIFDEPQRANEWGSDLFGEGDYLAF